MQRSAAKTFGIVGLLALFLAASWIVAGQAMAGPFNDGRLFLTVRPSPDAPGWEPPACEDAETSAPLPAEGFLVSIIADFSRPTPPDLEWVSFGVDYDSDLLSITSFFSANAVIPEGNWPEPGSGIRLQWDRAKMGSAVEIGRFRLLTKTDQPALLELNGGPSGGLFGDFIFQEPIDGFGSFGVGREGVVQCVVEGNCCLVDGTCDVRTPDWCEWYDGVDPDGADCSFCEDAGACCNDWSCQLTLEAECDPSSVWMGGGTTCDPNVCIPLGSCCLKDGSCVQVNENECNGQDGWFTPDGACGPDPCAKLGACCHYSWVECQLTTAEACGAGGSQFHGVGSTCVPGIICPPGICCVGEADDCLYTTEENCDDLGGNFHEGAMGPRPQACWDYCCCGPVEEGSWGSIKRRFLNEIPADGTPVDEMPANEDK